MIYYVSGPVTVLEPGLAVIDCGGVGYGCRVTAYTASQLKLDKPARLYVTESLIGSSMIKQSAPMPVIPLPTPAARYEPLCPGSSNRSTVRV